MFLSCRDRTQVVTGLDLKSSGLCPRRFEPCRSRLQMYEQPGSNRRSHACEACVLTTRRCSRWFFGSATLRRKSGDAGYRSLYLSHAERALYHLSYTPDDK